MSIVIAISGNPGSGKSTVARALSRTLNCGPVVSEDDLHTTTHRSLDSMRDWLNRGGDVGEFDLSAVVQAARQRRMKADGLRDQGGFSSIVLLETQFGRAHPLLGDEVDVQCWIDVPPDVSLARKVAQLGRELQNPGLTMSLAERLEWISGYCDGYLNVVRDLLAHQIHRVRDTADIIVDGNQSAETVLREVLKSLRIRLSDSRGRLPACREHA